MDDKPGTLLRSLLNDAATIIDRMHARGFSEAEIATVCRIYAEAQLRPRRVAPTRPEPEWGWSDGAWVPLVGDETDAETDMTREEMSMRVSNMYPSKWLAAADLDDSDLVVTIEDIREEEVSKGESKWVLYFRERSKGLVLNKTNTKMISQLLGDETDDWVGRKITLFPTQVDFQGEQVEAIRVRKKLPQARKPQPAAARATGKPARPMTQAEADNPDPEDEVPF